MNTVGWLPFFLILTWIVWLNLKKWKKSKKLRMDCLENLATDFDQSRISLNPSDYIIEEKGFKRSNSVERRFKRRYFFDLLEVFDHKCFSCERSVKIECDHFFIPKSKGGNLMIQHRKGYWICNAILLCRACNSRKEDKSPEEFFTNEKLEECFPLLEKMSFLISEREC